MDHGFKPDGSVGVDASDKMLEKAKEKNAYSDLRKMYFGLKNLPREWENHFDVAVSTGAFLPDHLKNDCYDDFILSIKVGGYLVFSFREIFLKDADMGHEAAILKLLESGRIKAVKQVEWIKYKEYSEV